MIIGVGKVKLIAPWVTSLKEKRMIVQSLVSKTRHKFNVSIAEIEDMDVHQTIVLGISVVTNATKVANSMLDNVIEFIEANTEAEIMDVDIEVLH